MAEITENIRRYYDFWFRINDIYDKLAKSQGITVNTWCVLYIIDQHPNCCTLKFICEKSLLPKQTVHNILVNLADKGYLERKLQADDKRNKLITFTPLGQAYADDILGMFYTLEEQAFTNMGLENRSKFLESSAMFFRELRILFAAKEGEEI